jgi:hypothetical protein
MRQEELGAAWWLRQLGAVDEDGVGKGVDAIMHGSQAAVDDHPLLLDELGGVSAAAEAAACDCLCKHDEAIGRLYASFPT